MIKANCVCESKLKLCLSHTQLRTELDEKGFGPQKLGCHTEAKQNKINLKLFVCHLVCGNYTFGIAYLYSKPVDSHTSSSGGYYYD